MKGSQRITFRLGAAPIGLLRRRCAETGEDMSAVLRKAIEAYLGTQVEPPTGDADGKPAVPPEDIYGLVGPYLAWSGDLRKELRRQFVQLLAAAYVAAKHFPKTPWVKETYAGLLVLFQHFER